MKKLIILILAVALILSGCEFEGVIGTIEERLAQSVSDGKLHVFYVDVGQGDCSFIYLPNGKNMLIDAGEKDYGSKIIRALKEKGINKIDFLVATHPHSDHIGGMTQIVNFFDIDKIYMPKVAHTTETYQSLLNAIGRKEMKIHTAKAGVEIFNEENLSAIFVAPNSSDYDDLNNYSAVIKLTYGKNSFVFTGDAEKKSEDEIRTNIKCDVLKVGHHGSSSSTTANFLKKTEPKYAVISCGAGNDYGHPSEKVLARLNKSKAKIYRTDICGTVEAVSDGENIIFYTEKEVIE